jgi:hypothetical protein
MKIRFGLISATLSLAALSLSSSVRAADGDQGIGTWEGSGTASEISGKDLGGFTVTVTRKLISGGKVRADGVINLASGKRMAFWQEFENTRPHAFRLVSDRGTGGGECFANGLCQSLEQSSDGHAFATTIAPDGEGRLRILITELDKGQAVRFFQQTLRKK